MGMIKTAICVKELSFSYINSAILDNVNIEVDIGKLTIILGRNGSGKSTFLRILAGLLPVSEGTVTILGSDISGLSFSDRAKQVGFMNQQHKAIFPFPVEEVVLTGRAGHVNYSPKAYDRKVAHEAMEKVGIEHLRGRKYNELSGGEQQLVMIARVLAQNPKVLLLDEPTSHLDLYYQSRILRLLKDLRNEGMSIVCVFHDPNLAFIHGDDFLFVKEGQVIRSDAGCPPWDTNFLKTIYKVPLVSIPYNGRSLIVTELE